MRMYIDRYVHAYICHYINYRITLNKFLEKKKRNFQLSIIASKFETRKSNDGPKVQDVEEHVIELNWIRAVHLTRHGDGCWSKTLTVAKGRPKKTRSLVARWVDDIGIDAGKTWTREAQNRKVSGAKEDLYPVGDTGLK